MKNLLLALLLMLPMLAAAETTTTAEPAQTTATTTEAAPKRPRAKRKDFALKAQRVNSHRRNKSAGLFQQRVGGCGLSLPKVGMPAAVRN